MHGIKELLFLAWLSIRDDIKKLLSRGKVLVLAQFSAPVFRIGESMFDSLISPIWYHILPRFNPP